MSLVSLPGLPAMIEEISKRNNLPASAVEEEKEHDQQEA